MADKKEYPTTLAGLYSTRGGFQFRSMVLSAEKLDEMSEILSSVGPGAKIVLRESNAETKARKDKEMADAGKKGTFPDFFLEIMTADQLNAEREAVRANDV
jgi:hypothetical protein